MHAKERNTEILFNLISENSKDDSIRNVGLVKNRKHLLASKKKGIVCFHVGVVNEKEKFFFFPFFSLTLSFHRKINFSSFYFSIVRATPLLVVRNLQSE
jgi:hypothetical protein